MEAIKLTPVFDDLNNPITILNHIEELKAKSEATPHAEILHQLIEQFEPLDFELLAFPQAAKLREQLGKLENKLTNPDGSINTDQEFDIERERAEVLEYNKCFGNKNELTEQFKDVRKLSTQIEKPVLHLSLRLAPGESLTK